LFRNYDEDLGEILRTKTAGTYAPAMSSLQQVLSTTTPTNRTVQWAWHRFEQGSALHQRSQQSLYVSLGSLIKSAVKKVGEY